MYDLIIIGGGPAGITASVYAARKNMNFLLITKDIGGQASLSYKVENYTGFQFITGPDLVERFHDHLKNYNIKLKEDEAVTGIAQKNDFFVIQTDKTTYETKTVLIASGKKSRELGVPGESAYKNKGVTYCATCDAPLFAGKEVAVVGGGNSALDAALQLEKITKKIYIINILSHLTGDLILQDKLKKYSHIEVLNNSQIKKITGEKFVTGILVQTNNNERSIPVQGVFVEIGLIPNTQFAEIVKKNKIDEIIVNCAAETNIKGIFAAGDVTTIPDKQIIIAAGDGSKAVLGAYRYLNHVYTGG